MKKFSDNRDRHTAWKNILILFGEVLSGTKSVYLRLTKRLRRVCYKKLTFYEIVFGFFLAGCAEIVFRILWAPTPISFLFPVYIFAMYLKITQRQVDIREQGYLLLPFFLFTFFLGFLLIFTHSPKTDRIWIQCFRVAYGMVASIYMFPVITGIQNRLCSEYDSQKFFFIQFLSFAQLIATLLLFVILSPGKQIFTLTDPSKNFNPQWNILLILAVAVLISFQYLVLTKKPDEIEYPLTIRMKNYKKVIIYLFNERKIFLNPDLTLNMLSLEGKIDKPDLEFFFNEYIGKSFPYFVAEYRIAHAVKMIADQGDRYTLEAIGYECGFHCRTSFNKYFRLMTGMLPSEYLNIKKTG